MKSEFVYWLLFSDFSCYQPCRIYNFGKCDEPEIPKPFEMKFNKQAAETQNGRDKRDEGQCENKYKQT